MKTVNIHFAKTHLSKLIEEVTAGGEVIIAKAGKPLVRLVSIASAQKPRALGKLAGKIKESADAWDRDAELEGFFYNTPVDPPHRARVAERPRSPRKK